MASNKQGEEELEESQENSSEALEPTDFFEAEISRYSANLEADPEDTYQRYGFTLYHSLPPAQMVLESKKLGFFRGDAIDTYNLAGIEIGKENFPGAVELLDKSIKMDDSHADSYYNLALCLEQLDRKADALKNWKKYLELAETEAEEEEDESEESIEELEAVRAHVAELQA